jgi:hypothetical protein
MMGLTPRVYAAEVDCSVGELITALENATDGDILSLTEGCTYTLTAPYSNESAPDDLSNALPPINIDLTIDGNDAIIERSTGAPFFRLFLVGAAGNVTLNNLTIRNGALDQAGDNSNFDGGGIRNEGILNVNSSTISSNSARAGGGILNWFGGTVTVDNSTISDNSAKATGGGILNDGSFNALAGGTLTVTDSTFTGNSAGNGAGLYNNQINGTAILTNCTFSHNTAIFSGGGIDSFGALTLTHSTIADNSAGEFGGGLYAAAYNGGGLAQVINSTISANRAANGAGIAEIGGIIEITDSTISDNTADKDGGGIMLLAFGLLTVTRSTVSGNTANGDGGGIHIGGGTTILNSTVTGNSTKGKGGGLYTPSHTVYLGYSTVSANIGFQGGKDIFNENNDPILLNFFIGSSIIGNFSGSYAVIGPVGHEYLSLPDAPLGRMTSLAPLADNAGYTKTMAVRATAELGNCSSLDPTYFDPVTTDQRGMPRGTICTIGAYDLGETPPVVNIGIQLQGRPAPPDPRLVMSVRVVVTPQGSDSPIFDASVTTDENGKFFLRGVTSGNYHLWIKGAHTLAVERDVTLTDGTTNIPYDPLPEGDSDGNNVVNLTDFSILATTFGKQNGNTGYDGRADFNGDSVVNLTDFSLLATSFGKSGAP